MKLDISRIVGLEGLCNSGKSHVLKALCKILLALPNSRLLYVRQPNGEICSDSSRIDYRNDICAWIAVGGKNICIISGGDYVSLGKTIVDITVQVNIHIEVLFVAMRFLYPAVGEAFRKDMSEYGLKVKSIFKPGCKRVDHFPDGVLDWVDSIWVDLLMKEL